MDTHFVISVKVPVSLLQLHLMMVLKARKYVNIFLAKYIKRKLVFSHIIAFDNID